MLDGYPNVGWVARVWFRYGTGKRPTTIRTRIALGALSHRGVCNGIAARIPMQWRMVSVRFCRIRADGIPHEYPHPTP